jgi:hypothetical protein
VDIVVLDRVDCMRMMEEFIKSNPDLWFEDIGE